MRRDSENKKTNKYLIVWPQRCGSTIYYCAGIFNPDTQKIEKQIVGINSNYADRRARCAREAHRREPRLKIKHSKERI